ncbi:MAG: amidohydrolase [Acidimicrobiia bacterium]|nr:amidohydrolase [Acidimicrobiia bacterium]MDH5295249.1 amidohydrolase [Acidimicrobiia bacterium]
MHPQTILVNGTIFCADPARTMARAIAIRDDRIVAVGGDEAVLAAAGPETEIIDLQGRMVTPGFQDAHVHPASGGRILASCNLMEAGDAAGATDIISAYHTANPDGWLTGGGWRYTWFDRGCPSKETLDALTGDRPAYLTVADGHSGWANSAALSAAGIGAATPDPADGRIERNADGSPQGTLHEGAMDLVSAVIPPPTQSQMDDRVLAGQGYLFSKGVTAWQDAWVTQELHDTYLRLAETGRLRGNVRAAMWWDRLGDMDQIDRFLQARDQRHPRYVPGAVKLMLDGVCENYTASLLGSYLDDHGSPTGNHGLDMIDPEQLGQIVTELDRLGFQCHFHAIGDAAVRSALDAVESARMANGWSDLRHHIAHIQFVEPSDLPRFRRLGVAANAQPLWACNEPAVTELTIPFVGDDRALTMYPFGSLLEHGAVMAMGSDWSVSTADVMDQISVAVSRQVPETSDSEPFLPAERIELADALCAFTSGSAWVNHLESDRGTIHTGAVADLTVLSANPFDVEAIFDVEVDLTYVDGEVVYERGTL